MLIFLKAGGWLFYFVFQVGWDLDLVLQHNPQSEADKWEVGVDHSVRVGAPLTGVANVL